MKRVLLAVLAGVLVSSTADARPRLFARLRGQQCGQTERPVLSAAANATREARRVAATPVVILSETMHGAANVIGGTGAVIRGGNCVGDVCR